MINQTTEKTKCDVADCKNLAACFISAKGKVGKFFLCSDCYNKLVAEAIAARTPKSPKNTIKRMIEKKEEQAKL